MSLKRKAAEAATADAKKVKANGSITSFFGPPKIVSKTISTTTKTTTDTSTGKTIETTVATVLEEAEFPKPKFDKKKWADKLTTEQKELLGLEIETLDESWFAVLKEELVSKEFLDLKRFLRQEHDGKKKIFPPAEDVYSWHVPIASRYITPSILASASAKFNCNGSTADCYEQVSPYSSQYS